MPTIKLTPSTYYLSSTSYLSVSNANNMYDDCDSTSYATVTNSRTSTTSYYIYVRGFNFSAIPSNAIVNSFTIRLKGNYSGGYSQNMYLYDGTTAMSGSSSSLSTTVATHTFSSAPTWDDIVDAGNDFGIRINCRRASRNTTSYIYIYGAEIEVDYTIPVACTITSALTGNGTIAPSGAYSTYEGAEYELTITPTNKSDTVTVTNNGVDVTAQLVRHGTEHSANFTADDHTTSGIQSGSSYASGCIGYTAENPNYNYDDSNMYASSSSTGYARYSFDFSSIPSNANIESIEVKAYGHRESNTISSTYVSQCVLYQGTTAISDEVDFPSTNPSMITLTTDAVLTRSELDSVTLRHYVGYYGGLVQGITFTVVYSTGEGTLDHYTYTFATTGDATIAVVIGGSVAQDVLKIKRGTAYSTVITGYKKINGVWTAQTDVADLYSYLNTHSVKKG